MPKFPKVARFILTFLIVYFILIVLAGVSGFRSGFVNSFANWATKSYQHFIPNAEASFTPNKAGDEYDLVITFMNTKTKDSLIAAAQQSGQPTVNLDVSTSNFSVWDYFLLQFIVLAALSLASPVSWKRKGISFLMGSVLLGVFTIHRFNCSLKYYANKSPVLEPLGLSSFSEKYINGVFAMQSIEFIFLSTFIIWALTTVRREDVGRFIGK